MEQIKELITAYLPTLTSIAALIASLITFLNKVKTLVSGSLKENETLKKAINAVIAANDDFKAHTDEFNASVNETINLLKTELETAKNELAAEKELNAKYLDMEDKYEQLIDEVNTVKAQNTRLIKEIEEE